MELCDDNRQLVSMVLAVVIEGAHGKSLEKAASDLIRGLDANMPPDLLELAVVGLKTAVRSEFRHMVATRKWQLNHKGGLNMRGTCPPPPSAPPRTDLACKECGETKFLQPDPVGYYCDARNKSGAPMLCTNPDCSRGRLK